MAGTDNHHLLRSQTLKQLETIKQAVVDYCRECGIDDTNERLYVADLALSLLDLGTISIYDMRRGLDEAIGPCGSRATMSAGLGHDGLPIKWLRRTASRKA